MMSLNANNQRNEDFTDKKLAPQGIEEVFVWWQAQGRKPIFVTKWPSTSYGNPFGIQSGKDPRIKEKKAFRRIKFMIQLLCCLILTSCTSQANRGDEKNAPEEGQTSQTILLNKPINDVVRTVFQDSKGIIWFGTQGGAFKLAGDSLSYIDSIRSELGGRVTIKDIAEDKEGIIWIGHTDGISRIEGTVVTNYYESDGLISNDVWCIETDASGHVWIGTIAGTCIFDGQKFTPFELPEGKIDTTLGISSTKMIHSILEDSKGTIWLCTNAGLFSYCNKTLKHIAKQEGSASNFASKLVEDKNGGFLVSTSKGLYHLKGETLSAITARYFKEPKGTGSVIVDTKGDIWFNCGRSIYRLRGEELSEYRIEEGNYGPLTFQIYEDQQKRLWFVGYGGAYRLENEKFIAITQNGPW